MASMDILSEALSSITGVKLEEISRQRELYETGKAKLLAAVVHNEPNQLRKLRILLEGIEDLQFMGKITDNPAISLHNMNRIAVQAERDPSISKEVLEDYRDKLEKELDVHSLRYEYASLYGELVNEWLSKSRGSAVDLNFDLLDLSSNPGDDFEQVGSKELHEQRALWEKYVFTAKETDVDAITAHLHRLFNQNRPTSAALLVLRAAIQNFEKYMTKTVHFDEVSMEWVIMGLLRSDLLTDPKREVLKDFLRNKVVLAEVADILNMRISALDKWAWTNPTPVEPRRGLNGKYRFFHDEDLLHSILLRYIGVKWNVMLRHELIEFHKTAGVWKVPSKTIPAADQKRRDLFLGRDDRTPQNCEPCTVEQHRTQNYDDEIFLEQLQDSVDEVRGGYDGDSKDSDTRKSPQQITQSVLHLLATEIIMRTRLGEEITVVRSDFKLFGPSLPHLTMFTVLKFFGVSDRWTGFFRRALEVPMQFVTDGPSAAVQVRKNGTSVSSPLSDMLGESVLFCLDFAVNQSTGGARLYRLHDDIWLWGNDTTCVAGWNSMLAFAKVMGLEFNMEKTGSVKVSRTGRAASPPASLPKGDVRWGLLKLDAGSGRFLIDQALVDTHIEELRRQLSACKSVFDWIQVWNIYGVRFFASNFGRPAKCFGRQHVEMILQTFSRIQQNLFFEDGLGAKGNATTKVKEMLTQRFGVKDIPDGYLYFPAGMGGLGLKNPFVNLYLVRDELRNPDTYMTKFFKQEETAYFKAKSDFENHVTVRAHDDNELWGDEFMSFEEYTRYRLQTSTLLGKIYAQMLGAPSVKELSYSSSVSSAVMDWSELQPYQRWIIQQYASDMMARFGGLNVVEKGLLPAGMVDMLRERRFKWQS